MDFHCNRIVSLAGRDGDLAGHVLCASKGAAEVVSELCNAIAETLLDVKVYKGQLESMFKSIALGREQASENLDIQEETGDLEQPRGVPSDLFRGQGFCGCGGGRGH